MNDSAEEQSFEAAMKAIISRKKPAKADQSCKTVSESHEEKIRQMLSDYSSNPLEKMDQSISFFWRNMSQGDKYQKAFSEVAKKYLTPPPSSVDVERLFSTCGNVSSDKPILLPETLKRRVFLRESLCKVNFDY